jgi:hypothetical protein
VASVDVDMEVGALFVNADGFPNRLFVHNFSQKDEIANLIKVSKHSLEF